MFSRPKSKFYYWHFCVSLIVLKYILVTVVDYYQYLYLNQSSLPSDLHGIIDGGSWASISSTSRRHFNYVFWENFFISATSLAIIGFGLLPRAWDAVTRFTNSKMPGAIGPEEAFRRSAFFYFLFTIFEAMIFIPVVFIWRGKFNFIDWASQIFALSVMGLANWLYLGVIRWGCKRKILSIALCTVSIAVLITVVTIFVPGFLLDSFPGLDALGSQYTPGIVALLTKVGFPVNRVGVWPGMVNAFNIGVGSLSAIIIGSGLVDIGATPKIIEGVVAHELGHWSYNHLVINPILTVLYVALYYFLFFYVIDRPRFYRAFGFSEHQQAPLGVGLIIFQIIVLQLTFIMKPLTNYIVWIYEYQADGFAGKLGYASEMIQMLVFFTKAENLHEVPIMTVLYGLFHADHPVLSARVAALRQYL